MFGVCTTGCRVPPFRLRFDPWWELGLARDGPAAGSRGRQPAIVLNCLEVSKSVDEQKLRSPVRRAEQFARRIGLGLPILLAPMAGASPASLSIAVAGAGGLGACGALLLAPEEIQTWSDEFRAGSQGGGFQINLWIPQTPAPRDLALETKQREFLATWGPPVPPEAGNPRLPDFDAQCEVILRIGPKAISSIMGLYAPEFVAKLKAKGILWFATATTVAEAKAAEDAGADAVIAQGMEAGGHRGAFRASEAESQMVGLMALVPQMVDALSVPVIAAGGIADGRTIAAALLLGAQAVQIGTGFLRCPEAKTHPAYAARLARTEAHETMITRVFSGRSGRSVATALVRAAHAPEAPPAAPYPVQRGLTRAMRELAQKTGDADRMQMWAGQSAKMAQDQPAAVLCRRWWDDAARLLS
jgi:nitronate monooxygenase